MCVLKPCRLEGSMLCLRPEVTSLELLYLVGPVKTRISVEYHIETVTMYNTVENVLSIPQRSQFASAN